MCKFITNTLRFPQWDGKSVTRGQGWLPQHVRDHPAADQHKNDGPEQTEDVIDDALGLQKEQHAKQDQHTTPKDIIASHLDSDCFRLA